MVIRFLCPNDHPLSAPENMAGKAGKCPKCGLAFVVPTLEELAEAAETAEQAEGEEASASSTGEASNGSVEGKGGAGNDPGASSVPMGQPMSASGAFDLGGSHTGVVGVGSGTGSETREVFVFLCPNGHKLNGPPSLKGKPGQCPHCGERFRIPSDDDLLEPSPEEEDAPPADEHSEASGEDPFAPPLEAEPEAEHEEEVVDVSEEDIEVYVDPPLAEGHALGYIFARLWDQREENTQVELYMKEGELLTPQFYCDNLSCREYGVFANQDGDESYSFMLVNWDDVRRINFRKISILPRPMFR